MNKKEKITRRDKLLKVRVSEKELSTLKARASLNHKSDVSKYVRSRLRLSK